MENKRATNYKLKCLLFFIVLIGVLFYMRGHFNQIYKERSRSRLRNFKVDHARHTFSDLNPDKTHSNRYSNLQDDKGDKSTGDSAMDKKSDKTSLYRSSNLNKDKSGQNTGDFAKKEHVTTKIDDVPDKSKTWSDDTNKMNTHRKENNESDIVKKSDAPIVEKTAEKPLLSKASVNVHKSVANKTSSGRKKLTLSTVTKIVREILDRLNISRSNTTFGRQLKATNTLSNATVGNISKEILRQNFSRTVAKAVISVLTNGPRNHTLQNQLWKDYLNNTHQLRLNNYLQKAGIRDSSQRASYVDKYQQLDGKLQPKSSHDYPSQRVKSQRYRDSSQKLHYRGVHPQSAYRDSQVKPTYRDQPQLGLRDQPQLGLRDQPQLRTRQQTQQRYKDQQQPRYRVNRLPVGNGSQQSRYIDIHGPSKFRQNQLQMLKGDQQPSKNLNDGSLQFKHRDSRQLPGYSNERQKRKDGEYAQQTMKRNIQQRYQANPIHKRSADTENPNWYRDSTQLKFLMDHPDRKRSVDDIEKTDKEPGNEVKKLKEKRSLQDIIETDKIGKQQGNEVKKRSVEDIKETEQIDKEQGKEVNNVDIKRSVEEPPKAKTLAKQDKT